MYQLMIGIFTWALGSAIARLLGGAGLAIASYSVISDYVDDALLALTNGLGALGSVGSLLYLAGIGQAISIIGSAILASAALMSARIFLARQ
jgi:hypothetical protein